MRPSPMPDPVTGEPRPPAAPRLTDAATPTPTDREPRKPPPLPDGVGPMLEWQQYRPRTGITVAAFVSLLIAGIATAEYGDLTWMTDWVYWAIVAPLWWFYPVVVVRRSWLAAGADWVQSGRDWVNTYELVRIAVDVNGIQRVIRLSDSSGRHVRAATLADIQANPGMWDLVYNGMLHSIAGGACEVTPRAQKFLRLPNGTGKRTRARHGGIGMHR